MTNLKNQETNLQNADTLRKCKVCGDYMIQGHIEIAVACNYYYCSEDCLNKALTKKEQESGFEADELYYTEWHDSEVYVVFDNQYATLEDAEYIKGNRGNCFTKIKVKTINLDLPVFKIVAGEQVEIEELTFI